MHKLSYCRPADNWNEALPIGNGRLGTMVFGGVVQERLALNDDSLWSGGFSDRINPDAATNIPLIQQLIHNGEIAEAQALACAAFSGTPDYSRNYEPLADLMLEYQDNHAHAIPRQSSHQYPPYARYRGVRLYEDA